ncbi:MAG: flagellar FlbD family protein [Myxococcota bacterium]
MIPLTRLDRSEVLVNPDLILTVEKTPDTLITFNTGAHLMVRESMEDIVERVVHFRRRINNAIPFQATAREGD